MHVKEEVRACMLLATNMWQISCAAQTDIVDCREVVMPDGCGYVYWRLAVCGSYFGCHPVQDPLRLM
jgi:hypothetical protein